MGDLFYVVRKKDNQWDYVCYGKRLELLFNKDALQATFLFIEDTIGGYDFVSFISGSASFESHAMKQFKCGVQEWTDYVDDCSDEYLGYAEEI